MTDATAIADIEPPISFADPDVQQCPFHAYDALRGEHPVYKDPLTGFYVLTRYEDIRKVVLNPRLWSNQTGLISIKEGPVRAELDRIYETRGWAPLDTLVTNDPPSHRLYRALVDKAFSTLRVTALEPRIQAIIDELIEGFIDDGEVEFLRDFAVKLPMFVIAEQLGVARSDMDLFKLWSDVSVEQNGPTTTPERDVEIAMLITDMQQYIARVVEAVRIEPKDTLLSHLVHAEVEGRRLDMREILSIVHQLLVAGNETTTTALAGGMKLLIDRPELAGELRADPERIPAFVEETLRLMAPVQTLFRRALEDTEIRGVPIPKGAIVEVRYGAANRDPGVFADPERLDLDRTNGKSHLTFGWGIHLCIGNQLARGELRLAFQALTRRMENFRAARGADSYVYVKSYIAYGLTTLWLAFDRRAAPEGSSAASP